MIEIGPNLTNALVMIAIAAASAFSISVLETVKTMDPERLTNADSHRLIELSDKYRHDGEIGEMVALFEAHILRSSYRVHKRRSARDAWVAALDDEHWTASEPRAAGEKPKSKLQAVSFGLALVLMWLLLAMMVDLRPHWMVSVAAMSFGFWGTYFFRRWIRSV